MNKIVIIYESKYGSTKRYAKWIADALSCQIFEKKNFRSENLSQYDTVIYGGGLYAGSVSGIKFITQNWKLLSDKRVVLFTCGLADPDNPHDISVIRESLSRILSEDKLNHLCLFHLRGGIDYSRLNLVHRSMMAMMRKMLLKKGAHSLREEDQLFLDTYGKCVDFTDKASIRPLVDYISSLSG